MLLPAISKALLRQLPPRLLLLPSPAIRCLATFPAQPCRLNLPPLSSEFRHSPWASPRLGAAPSAWFSTSRQLLQEPGSPAISDSAESAPNEPLKSDDARVIFDSVWSKLVAKYGEENLRFPDEIIYMMGAPGAGKGTHTAFLQKTREIVAPPIVMSSLLTAPEFKSIIDSGRMISDSSILELLMEHLLTIRTGGAIVDGFPRTQIQVECTIRLYDKLMELRRKYFDSHLRDNFLRPRFRISVLFIEKEESTKRQLARGQAAKVQNEMVRRKGQGTLVEERATDFDIELIQRRYDIFREHYDAMLRLKERFPFHLIDASASIEEVRAIILKEFEYQSSMELDGETYDAIQHLPLAIEVGRHARQQLVRRLESYQVHYKDLFQEGIFFIDTEIMPVIRRHAIGGRASIRTENPLCAKPMLIDIVLDILSERGYHIIFDSKEIETPEAVDPQTFRILVSRKKVYFFHIQFPRHHLRHLADPS